jgi:hypothetical protein
VPAALDVGPTIAGVAVHTERPWPRCKIERLVLRHDELKRTNALLEEKLAQVGSERDSLKSRLGAARARIDALLERLPAGAANHRAPER